MSNDLISRSALLESVNYYYTHTPNDSPEHYAYGVALKEIREHPTAFDKKRVIEKLKDAKDIPHDDSMAETISTRIWNKAITKSIKIVEKGGIE